MTNELVTKGHCAATTVWGAPCRMRPLRDSAFCFNHTPELAVRRAHSRKLGGLRRRRASPEGVPERIALRTVEEARALLERAARDALMLDLSPDRCRVLISAVGQALKVVEVGELETRIAALEERVGGIGHSTHPESGLT